MAMWLPARPKYTCIAHLPTKTNVYATFHKLQSKTEEVVQSARSYLDLQPLICRYHGNILPGTVKKMRLAHLQPKAHMCAKFYGNWAKTEKEVCNTKFSNILAHNI